MNINIEDLRIIVQESLQGRFKIEKNHLDEDVLTTFATNSERQFIETTKNLIIGKVIKKSSEYDKA